MPRILGVVPLALLAACAQTTPSSDVFAPVQPAPTATVAPAPTPVDDPELEEIFDERTDEDTEDGAASADRLAAGLGLTGPVDEPAPVEPQAPAQPELDAPVMPPAPQVLYIQPPTWTPGAPLDGSFGLRLVSTVVDAQPPRAILGMPSGDEQVVQPGTLLPEVGVVVLAIGQDVVQVAEIVPVGDHARVDTRLLTSMYPAGSRVGFPTP